MMTALRRILFTVLIGGLAGLGVITALLGRRQRKRVAMQAEELIPVPAPSPAGRRTGGGRRAALVFVCPLLLIGLAGIVYESRDVIFDHAAPSPDVDRKPLAALSGPIIGTSRPRVATDEMATGSLRIPEPDASASAQTPPTPSSVSPGSDILRVEPNGSASVAGRVAPHDVEGKPLADTRAVAGGHRTPTSPDLPTGNSHPDRRAADADEATRHPPGHVASMAAPHRDVAPLGAVTSPGKPTEALSEPDGATAIGSGTSTGQAASKPRAENDASPNHETPMQIEDQANRAASLPRPDADTPRPGVTTEPSRAGNDIAPKPVEPAQDPSAAATDSASGEPDAAGPKVISVEPAEGGRWLVTAKAAAGTNLRLYVNDTLIAPAIVGRDGTVTFTIDHGVARGNDRLRLDRVDPATGTVRDRAEIPFTALANHHDGVGSPDAQQVGPRVAAGSGANDREAPRDIGRRDETAMVSPQPPETGSLHARGPAGSNAGSSDVHGPGIETTRIVRGDNLWTISRRTYGQGRRYTLIYDANRKRIRDPDLIYPGQIFVLPNANGAAVRTSERVD